VGGIEIDDKETGSMKRVKDLPKFGRPREKLREKGAEALSDTELVAILLGSGSRDRDVMTLAAKVAKLISGKRGDISMEMLSSVEGIGLAKASKILAGFELASSLSGLTF